MSSKVSCICLLALIFFFYSPIYTYAQVVINEFCPACDPEWVELYNNSDQAVDLEGWDIQDGNTKSTDDLTISGTISPHSFLVFEHPKGWLNDSSDDSVVLFDKAGIQIDIFSYSSTSKNKTFSRIPDGTGDFQANTDPTPNSNNSTPPTSTSTPTPTPTPTKISTPTTVATPLPASTSTPTPSTLKLAAATPTSTPSLHLSSSPSSTSTSEPQVLSASSSSTSLTISSSPTPTASPSSDPSSSPLPYIFSISGIGFISSAAFLYLRRTGHLPVLK